MKDNSGRFAKTRALREHAGMVLRRLTGETANTAPVMTLITQFGGGKTHTLTALYHLVTNGAKAIDYPGIDNLIKEAGMSTVPRARVATFVGNAWDPQEGRKTPWIDVARQLAGDKGVKELGAAAKTTPPGTEALARVFQAAGGPVLLLFDEVLNFLNRHRGMADQFHAFIQNLTVATTGTTQGAAVISLPRSQVEMTEWDMQWQDRITKVVRRVAAIDSDISGAQSHARALDADTKGALRNIHRRVATTILFESSGGQIDKVAHLPELRFALGEPEVDTTSVDNAAFALEDKSYFIRRVGSDGFKISHQPTAMASL